MLKLYVWNVFNEFTKGVAFAYAENVKQARSLILHKIRDECLASDSFIKELRGQPHEVTEATGFYHYSY